MASEYRRIFQLSIVAIVLIFYSLYAFFQIYLRPEINATSVTAVYPSKELPHLSVNDTQVIPHNADIVRTENAIQESALRAKIEMFSDEPVEFDADKYPMLETASKAEHQAESLRKIEVHTQMAIVAITATTAQAGSNMANLQRDADKPSLPPVQPNVALKYPKQPMVTREATELQDVDPTLVQRTNTISLFEGHNIPAAAPHQVLQRSAPPLEVASPEVTAAPVVSRRPVARPNSMAVWVTRSVRPPSSRQTPKLAAQTSAVATSAEYAGQRRSNMPPMAGVIIGVFETPSGSWALLEDIQGNIAILREGHRVGNSTISKIRNGRLVLNGGGQELFPGSGLR